MPAVVMVGKNPETRLSRVDLRLQATQAGSLPLAVSDECPRLCTVRSNLCVPLVIISVAVTTSSLLLFE